MPDVRRQPCVVIFAGQLAFLAVLLASCAGGPSGSPGTVVAAPPGSTPVVQNDQGPLPPPKVAASVAPAMADGFGPEILLPREDAKDDEVARVGDLVLRQSHAFTRLLSANPNLALSAVDLLIFDVLVARHAEQGTLLAGHIASRRICGAVGGARGR